ncbi:MAG: AAA family ATPase [Rhodospirillaceae bacterium]|nr:AAA family ATPase [Rhodospirillaceae bacterium]
MRRVMIIGPSGAGKSTFARRLSEKTQLPVVHVDQILWTEGWVNRPDDDVRRLVEDAAGQPTWIFEGNHAASLDLRLSRADTLIFLDFPTRVCLFRILKRVICGYGRVRADMAPGCPERFDWEFLKWVYSFNRTERPGLIELIKQAPQAVVVHRLHDRKAAESFLETA